MSWQVQEAKQRLSVLLASAHERPQTITRHGRPYAVVLSVAEYDRLVGRESFKEFLRSAPDLGDLPPRDRRPARQVDL